MNNKKTIIILILVLTIGIVGLTVAYFLNSTSLDNTFVTNPYGNTFTETFIAPTNWLPGDTTTKQIIATNTGSVDQAVRISLTEAWTPSNSNSTLNGWIHTDGTKSTHSTESELATDERVAVINLANTGDWTKVGDYYYYNYKLAPNESTSTLIDSVTFNSKTKLDDTCVTTTNGSTKTVTCNSSGSDYDNATYTLTFNIETVQYNKYQEAWSTNFAIASEKPSSGVDYLLSNEKNADGAAYNNQTKSKMFKMSHPQTAQTPAQTEYRYIGDNPNNYVYFNCDSLDNQNEDTCEVWRIIGVFDVDDGTGNYEQRIELVRGSALPDKKQWDYNRNGENLMFSGFGKNDWNGSLMQIYLNDNGEYYTRSGSAANYGLKSSAKILIENAKYYLGAISFNDRNKNADSLYLEERSNIVYNYENYCLNNPSYYKCTTENYCENNPTDSFCNISNRPINWIGRISLMYPSDQYLVYANGVNAGCYGHTGYCSTNDTEIIVMYLLVGFITVILLMGKMILYILGF